MQRTLITVADATRARLFTFDRVDDDGELREVLSERTDLVHSARHRTPAQLFSDTRTNFSRTGGKLFGEDDHRAAHIDGLDLEFARSIAAAIEEAVRDTGATRVILCAAPRLLGMLRPAVLRGTGVAIDELARDYVKMSPSQIRELLANRGLLPAPVARPGLARRA